jgi:hypothetical protein
MALRPQGRECSLGAPAWHLSPTTTLRGRCRSAFNLLPATRPNSDAEHLRALALSEEQPERHADRNREQLGHDDENDNPEVRRRVAFSVSGLVGRPGPKETDPLVRTGLLWMGCGGPSTIRVCSGSRQLRVAAHEPDVRAALGRVRLLDDLESEALVEGNVARRARLEN